ncbi:hypothetical protein GCM10023149_38070 [Mucilaginibacter gynuensis]|uniref:Uncharacterized protein n=1 Tax=Mucilaginibacter gynuensis TaxID=1302236 RepID=A0ABP8H019_9SPHI
MNDYISSGLLFFIVFIIVGIAGGILYLIYVPIRNWLLRSGKLTASKSLLINRIYVLIILLISGYETYTAIFPDDSFYKDEFEINTGIQLPDSVSLTDKNSSYLDIYGDYCATAIIKLDASDYAKIKNQITNKPDFDIDKASQKAGVYSGFYDITKKIKDKDNDIGVVLFNKEKQWFKVAFLKDNRTIIFEKCSY